ncbi:15113_t:CDS:2 [Cetraspora pellucida]|uniref:15113_t:CDS:1 n=1 Tax=Cetraspora pellucida TaxID=1433469 RepID=A0A9N9DFV3_9GLOM|nr:15113_t:CDS:2 [Cetraspora pellucida]
MIIIKLEPGPVTFHDGYTIFIKENDFCIYLIETNGRSQDKLTANTTTTYNTIPNPNSRQYCGCIILEQ